MGDNRIGTTDAAKWPQNVRVAREEDEAALFDLLTALYKDNGIGVAPLAQDMRMAIRAGTRERNGVLIGVIDGKDGVLAGSVCIVPTTWWFNHESWYLAVRYLFVRPEYREQHAAFYDDLFQFARAYRNMAADGRARIPLVTDVTGLDHLDEKMKLWAQHGKLVGGIYLVEDAPQVSARDAAA